MQNKNVWIGEMRNTITITKQLLSRLSIRIRSDQYRIFERLIHPTPTDKILDVGANSDETLPDSNMLEKLYPYPKNLTAATIEDKTKLEALYPKIKVVKILQRKKLPFKNNQFDIVVSWATIEHVGNLKDQTFFLKELCRVGKKIFVTTPYRGCIYEPHTGTFFLHWLPIKVFRFYLQLKGDSIWASDQVLNPLFTRDIKGMLPRTKYSIIVYRLFGILPSHLLLIIS